MAIDQAGDDDSVDCIDHLRVGGIDLGRDGGNLAAFDQHVAFHQVADFGVHADDGAALEQDAALWIDALLMVEATLSSATAVSDNPPPAAAPAASVIPTLSAPRREMRASSVMIDPPVVLPFA